MTNSEAACAVGALFSYWYASLVRYAWRATGRLELAEDLAQEVFMRLYRELRNGKTIHEPKSWTLCVLQHEIGKLKRDEHRHLPLDDLESLPAAQPASAEIETDEITKLFSVLTRREEEVVLLRLASLKYREIGEKLGISSNAVNTLLARALRKLQKAAKGNAEDYVVSDSEDVARRVRKTLQ